MRLGPLLVAGLLCAACGGRSSDPVTDTIDEALGCVTTQVDGPPELFEVVGVTAEEAATPIDLESKVRLWTGPIPFEVPLGGQVWLVSLDEDYSLGVKLTVPADPDLPAAELSSVPAWGGRFVLTCPRNKFQGSAATAETQAVAIATLGLPEAEARALVEAAGLVFRRARIDGAGTNMTDDLRMDRVNVALVDGQVRQASVF